jgi:hypothetical protein
VNLQAFIDQVRQECPETIEASVLTDVYPKPWVTRHGSGTGTRTLMSIGGKGLWYERQPGDSRWVRVDDASEFDVLVNA